MPRILIVTGEASGDLHGANLARAILSLDPATELVGIGGTGMRDAGVKLIPGIPQLDVMGLIGLSAVRSVVRRIRAIRRVLKSESWDLVVLIDNPGLNFHFARVAKAAGLRVLYYIAPQVWAWRPRRMKWIQRRVDHVVVILPFEEELYRQAGVRCTFVGHPLLDAVAPSYDRAELMRRFELAPEGPVVGLLPGSRAAEVKMLMPVLLQAAAKLAAADPRTQFIVARASSIDDALIHSLVDSSPVPVRIVREQASEVMAASDALLIASGTATLQAAVVGTPMVLLYKTTPVTYQLARRLIRVKWIGLVNLVAGRTIVPEYIQHDATPDRLSAEIRRLLTDRRACSEMKAGLREVRESLGIPGASHRAAKVVLAECRA
ncbi:Lipid-A-disaccharide synthase [Nitrospira sp. KM1]|uniref:lipid-A-disaccharide synthase n=1 Tax=Nitrospira sp. KM1 TaxID=1936990 RepID=UPI0013A7B2AC|nr:lipid-A-disaccharide synthase [Nitrospira sp. KM1]BCA54251.1 Lipid-A-disaccharide synthase [Nitrospira sp. KM1]